MTIHNDVDIPYCVENECHQPAVAQRLDSMTADGTPIVELVCYCHAWETT